MEEGDDVDYKDDVTKIISIMTVIFLAISIWVMGHFYYSVMIMMAKSLLSCVGLLDIISTLGLIFMFTIMTGVLITIWIIAVLLIFKIVKEYFE